MSTKPKSDAVVAATLLTAEALRSSIAAQFFYGSDTSGAQEDIVKLHTKLVDHLSQYDNLEAAEISKAFAAMSS